MCLMHSSLASYPMMRRHMLPVYSVSKQGMRYTSSMV